MGWGGQNEVPLIFLFPCIIFDIIGQTAPLKPCEENERNEIGKIIKPRQSHLAEKQSEFTGFEGSAALKS